MEANLTVHFFSQILFLHKIKRSISLYNVKTHDLNNNLDNLETYYLNKPIGQLWKNNPVMLLVEILV